MLWAMENNYDSNRFESNVGHVATNNSNADDSSYSTLPDEYNPPPPNSNCKRKMKKLSRPKEECAAREKVLKHKRRYCREPGCDRIVKSQGLCQRHGARPKKCRVEECCKQAQGSFMGMCKSHFRLSQTKHQPAISASKNEKSLKFQSPVIEDDRPTIVHFCKPIVSTAEDDETPGYQWAESYSRKTEMGIDTVTSSSTNWDPTLFGSTDALAEDIAILESSSSRYAVALPAPNQAGNSHLHWKRNQQDIRSIKRGEVSPTFDPIPDRPQRVVRWSTVEMMMSGDSENTMADNVTSEQYNDAANMHTYFSGNGQPAVRHRQGRSNDLLLQRPSSLSKRNFSTDTNFTIDENMIDHDLDCENAFDSIFAAGTTANQDFEHNPNFDHEK